MVNTINLVVRTQSINYLRELSDTATFMYLNNFKNFNYSWSNNNNWS